MDIPEMKMPYVGMVINDCYMSGAGERDHMGESGRVEAFGKDWMLVRPDDGSRPILVHDEDYWCIEELRD